VALFNWLHLLGGEYVFDRLDDVRMDDLRRRLSGIDNRLLDRMSSVGDGTLGDLLLFSTLSHSILQFLMSSAIMGTAGHVC
jgi:hypothetical protein